jgi:hypothetical protein
MGESAQFIVPRRRAHDAMLSPRAHICDRRRLHHRRAARQCVTLNSFPATSPTPRRLSDSPSKVPLCPTCSSKLHASVTSLSNPSNVSCPSACPSGTIAIEPAARDYLLECQVAGLRHPYRRLQPVYLAPPVCHSLRLGQHRTTPCCQWAAMPSFFRT